MYACTNTYMYILLVREVYVLIYVHIMYTCIRQTCEYMYTYIHADIHEVHTYIHTHTCTHTYIHTYIQIQGLKTKLHEYEEAHRLRIADDESENDIDSPLKAAQKKRYVCMYAFMCDIYTQK